MLTFKTSGGNVINAKWSLIPVDNKPSENDVIFNTCRILSFIHLSPWVAEK